MKIVRFYIKMMQNRDSLSILCFRVISMYFKVNYNYWGYLTLIARTKRHVVGALEALFTANKYTYNICKLK